MYNIAYNSLNFTDFVKNKQHYKKSRSRIILSMQLFVSMAAILLRAFMGRSLIYHFYSFYELS